MPWNPGEEEKTRLASTGMLAKRISCTCLEQNISHVVTEKVQAQLHLQNPPPSHLLPVLTEGLNNPTIDSRPEVSLRKDTAFLGLL